MRWHVLAAAAVITLGSMASITLPAAADGIERPRAAKPKPAPRARPAPDLLGGPETATPAPLPAAPIERGLTLDPAFFTGGGGVGYGLTGASGCGCSGGRVLVINARRTKPGFARAG
jgi:hypothetical protein